MKKIFITHLHVDHFGALPYVWMFGTWSGGWHENLRVYGPSGRTPEYGTATMVEGMKMMTGWHRDAFSVFPVGKGSGSYSCESCSSRIFWFYPEATDTPYDALEDEDLQLVRLVAEFGSVTSAAKKMHGLHFFFSTIPDKTET